MCPKLVSYWICIPSIHYAYIVDYIDYLIMEFAGIGNKMSHGLYPCFGIRAKIRLNKAVCDKNVDKVWFHFMYDELGTH